ncbi:MAG: hypothetical protein ACTHNE_05760 [Dyella sp.]|uniref:hypothetical protein n=1 Tax=Dyella sp. TaxID=1869338 RepID=UPI003F81EA0C
MVSLKFFITLVLRRRKHPGKHLSIYLDYEETIMHSMTNRSHHLLFLAIGAIVLIGFGRPNVAHASWSSEGHAAGAQCGSSGVNDNAVVVGNCTPANATGPLIAWVAPNGVEELLAPLASGQSCSAAGVTDGNVVIGSCLDANNASFAVTWPVSSPNSITVLQSLPGLLGLGADVSTGATSFDQNGVIGGESVSATGNSTAVIWLNGSSTAVAVSNRNDNCGIADINNSNVNGAPSVALDCPNASGTTTAYIAQVTGGLLGTGLLGAYAKTPLPVPSGSSNCVVVAVNDNVQALGTCYFPGGSPQAAFWPSVSSAPILLSGGGLPDGTRTAGAFLNNNDDVVVQYQDTSGKTQSAFWDTNAALLYLILPVSGGTRTAATGLADNGTVILNSEDGNQQVQGTKWTVGSGTVAYGDYGGGLESVTTSISQSGNYTAGDGEGSAENENALVTSN